jgi:type IV secretion system protein VirD4
MSWPGSLIWVDPKLQAAAVLGRHLAENLKHDVKVLNPFGILEPYLRALKPARYNPMACLRPNWLGFGADCESIAEGIVVEEMRGSEGNHWALSARDLVAGLTAALAKYCDAPDRNLTVVRSLICGRELFEFCRSAMRSNDPFLMQKLGRFAAPGAEENKEILGIISSAITQSSFIGNEAIAESLKESTFSFRDLKRRPTALFFGLPARYLSPCSKWFRLIIAAAMNELLQEERGVPVLLALDEFAQLGHLKVIENAMALARGFGAQLLCVLQDLNQLKGTYRDSWETFLANAGCRIFFAPQDKFSSDYVSALAGEHEVRNVSKSVNDGPNEPGLNVGPHSRRYLLPHEVRDLNGDEMLVFGQGIPGVIRAGRRPYYQSPEFAGLYDPDPYHLPTAEVTKSQRLPRAGLRWLGQGGARG